VIEEERLPLSAALLEVAGRERAAEFALTGGDDYELCFTLPPEVEADDLSADVPVTAIGVVTAEPGIRLRRHGRDVPLPAGGYRHFGNES